MGRYWACPSNIARKIKLLIYGDFELKILIPYNKLIPKLNLG